MIVRVTVRTTPSDVFVLSSLVRHLGVSCWVGCAPGWKAMSLLVARIIRIFLGSWYGIRMLTPMNVGGWGVVEVVRFRVRCRDVTKYRGSSCFAVGNV